MPNRAHVETDDATFPSGDHYRVRGFKGIAFWVDGWETEPDEDTEWSGFETRTGFVLAVMVGDDRRHRVEPDDLERIDEADFCHVCGQIGCTHDGYDRSETDD
jgi:hypothetical protein